MRQKFCFRPARFFRSAVTVIGSVALFFVGAGLISNAVAASTRPNILLILADDLGFSDLGCYGGEIPTPNIDRLANMGIRSSAFYNSARCCPSRAALITGLHPHQAGIGSFTTARPDPKRGPAYTGHLLPETVTVAEALKAGGYSTWMVGKWHLGRPGPIERGFENYFGYASLLNHSEDQWNENLYVRLPQSRKAELAFPKGQFYATDAFTDYALEFLKQARSQKDKPWFLYLAHSSPHFPLQAPRESIDKHMAVYRKGWDVLRSERLERMIKLGILPPGTVLPPRSMVPVDEPAVANGYSGQRNPAWDSLPADRQEDLARRMATYAAMVEHVDKGVGRILKDLEQNGEMNNTVIFFLSDNGACYEWGPFGFDGISRMGINTLHHGQQLAKMGQPGTHHSYGSAWANLCNTPLNLYKHFCHEGGITSPFIMHWPGEVRAKGSWAHDPAHLVDIMPTIREAARVSYPRERSGRSIPTAEGLSLAAWCRGESLPERSLAFEHQLARGLRKGDWKVVWGKRMPEEPTWELYNLKTDRVEQQNLASEHPERTKELAEEWLTWARRVKVHPFYTEAPVAEAKTDPR